VSTPIRTVVVIIPARNEAALIRRCLDAILAARTFALDRLSDEPPTITITVVADACTDDTAVIAASVEGVRVIHTPDGNVGVARQAGVRFALATTDAPRESVWVANTDADSVVPQHWLLEQINLAGLGVDVMLGTVRPDFADLSAAHVRAWHATRKPVETSRSVHGANLGIRASHYLRAGGFRALAEHEDVDLIARCEKLGGTSFATDACEVMTSGRHHGRTPGGYARFLRVDLLARASNPDLSPTPATP